VGDGILSKLERNAAKDRDDADYLFRSRKLDAQILRDRYKNELRHNVIGNMEWHDKTFELWIEIFESQTFSAALNNWDLVVWRNAPAS